MMYENQLIAQEKAKLIDYQIIATIVFIISTTFSVVLLYNKKLIILNKVPLFGAQETKVANAALTTLGLMIILFLQYLNYSNKELIELGGESNETINLNISATYFLIIASFISMYAAYVSIEEGTRPLPITVPII